MQPRLEKDKSQRPTIAAHTASVTLVVVFVVVMLAVCVCVRVQLPVYMCVCACVILVLRHLLHRKFSVKVHWSPLANVATCTTKGQHLLSCTETLKQHPCLCINA